ncbi:MAG: GDSL-type esterase/lipase family protein [Planctomycetota bacterium]
MRRRARRLRTILLGVLSALIALELVMQVGAYVVWRSHGGFATRSVEGRNRVLCVGDSFTFGLGAPPERGYPQQLEQALKADGFDVAVVNGGKPGQDSADVLRRLSAQIATVKPTQVLVLVGYNDRWSHPAPLAADAQKETAETGFPLVWRTKALLFRITDWLLGSDKVAAPDAPAFLGIWHAGDFEIELRADGSLRLGERVTRWEIDGDELLLAFELDKRSRARWRIESARLILRMVDGAADLVFEPGPAAKGPVERARAAFERGDRDGASAIVAEGLAADAANVDLLAIRAQLAFGVGADNAADLERLRVAAAAGGEREVTARVEALLGTGHGDEGVTAACAWLGEHPRESRLWWVLARYVATASRSDPAIVEALDSALASVPRADPWRAALLRLRAGVLRNGRREMVTALANAIEAALVDGNKAHAVSWLQCGEFSEAQVDAALRMLALDPAPAARVAGWRHDAAKGPSEPSAVLAYHLGRMVAACRAAGAEPLLLTYPEDLGALGSAAPTVAREQGVTLIDCGPEFAARLGKLPRAELFVADGHCTERGYGVMALVAARALRGRLK